METDRRTTSTSHTIRINYTNAPDFFLFRREKKFDFWNKNEFSFEPTLNQVCVRMRRIYFSWKFRLKNQKRLSAIGSTPTQNIQLKPLLLPLGWRSDILSWIVYLLFYSTSYTVILLYKILYGNDYYYRWVGGLYLH